MKKIALAVVVLLVLSIGGCAAMILFIGGAGVANAACSTTPLTPDLTTSTSLSASATSSTAAAPVTGLPDRIGPYRGVQIRNAAEIILAGKALGISDRGLTIGIMTAMGESSLNNIDRGDAVGPDSRGLFQQRDNGAWGSYSDRMNPRIAATNFFKALLRVEGWEGMAPTLAAHRVQGNSDPYHYERYWNDAVEVAAALLGKPNLADLLPATGELPCAPGDGGSFTGPGGEFAREACSVRPDPSVGKGCLTPRTLSMYTQLKAQGWSLSCWDAHAWNPKSDHPLGKACDVFPGRGGVLPTAAQKAKGDGLVAALQASAKQTGVNYLIWYGQIWSVERADEGWRPYNGGGVYDPSDITGGHYDHVHVSMY